MNRRMFIATAMAAAVAPAALMAQSFEVTRSDAEWQAMLTQAEYNVMRREGTEAAGTSPLTKNFAPGTYHCRGCDLAIYPSRTKFESNTGWPSFYASFENALGTKVDYKIGVARTELHCRRCGSHLGHVFNDGPPPTGQRHCINGLSLVFRSA